MRVEWENQKIEHEMAESYIVVNGYSTAIIGTSKSEILIWSGDRREICMDRSRDVIILKYILEFVGKRFLWRIY
jgi:hypothetical protein